MLKRHLDTLTLIDVSHTSHVRRLNVRDLYSMAHTCRRVAEFSRRQMAFAAAVMLARGVGCRARAGARAVPSAKATQDNHDTKYQIRRTARGRGAVVCIYTAMQRRILAILYAIRLGVIFMWSSKHHRLQLQAAGCRLRAAQATHATATATQHPRGKRLPETRGVALHTTHTTQK